MNAPVKPPDAAAMRKTTALLHSHKRAASRSRLRTRCITCTVCPCVQHVHVRDLPQASGPLVDARTLSCKRLTPNDRGPRCLTTHSLLPAPAAKSVFPPDDQRVTAGSRNRLTAELLP